MAGLHGCHVGSNRRRGVHVGNLSRLVGFHEGDDCSGGTGTRSASGAVQVVLVIRWWVEVHDQVEVIDV